MNSRSGWLALLLLATTLFSADGALADWPPDGAAVFSTAKPYNQYSDKSVTDGAGGAIVAFLAGSPERLQVQRIDSNGEIRWGPDGLTLSDYGATHALSSDGAGGAFVAWHEGNLLAQHLDASGVPQWPGRGVTIGAIAGQRIIADGAGGAVIVFSATYAQRVSPSGSLMWGPNGVLVIRAPYNGRFTGHITARAIAPDGTGGVYVVTDDPDTYNYNGPGPTRVIRVIGTGQVVWTRTVNAVSAPGGRGGLVSDGANGVFVGWTSTSGVSRTQRLDPNGNSLWDPAGVPGYPHVTDGAGGVVLISDAGVARGVSGSGAPLWTSDGPVFGSRPWASYAFDWGGTALQADGIGGYIATSPTFISTPPISRGDSLYAQRLSATGERLWTNDGILLTAKPYSLMVPVPVGDGGLIYFFRSGPDSYTQTPRAQRLFPDRPTPTLISLVRAQASSDRVRLAWFASERAGLEATVYRRAVDEAWLDVGRVTSDGSGRIEWEDTRVMAGARYGYRLGVLASGREEYVGETWVDVPRSLALALLGSRPNPVRRELTLAFTLPSASPARIEVVDIAGRRRIERDVSALGPGSHLLSLAEESRLEPGLYLVRLTQEDRHVTARVTVVQ